MSTLLNNSTLNTSLMFMCCSFRKAASFVDHSAKGVAQHFFGLEELRNEPVSLPFKDRIKAITFTKSYLEIVVVLLNIPLKA